MMRNWKDLHILILGAARQGLALARYAARMGAVVLLNDQRTADQMEPEMKMLSGLPVRWALGGHPLTLLDGVELVCLSGGVPLNLPIVQEAARRGIPLTNDTQLFMELCPSPIIGITGSAGKTTTTTLVGRMASAGIAAPGKVWVGGNIGLPLIEYAGEMKKEDLVIMEISSFQLEQMTLSPHVAAILNITPNHLDRHGTLQEYTAAKARILEFQNEMDKTVLGCDDPGAWNLANRVHGTLIGFSLSALPARLTGTFEKDGFLWLREEHGDCRIAAISDILLRGSHNLLNVLAACSIAFAAGLPIEAMRAGIKGFRGIAHRLEWVADVNGSHWYNDSIATAPERSMAAIRSFTEPLVLMLGGRDKNLPWQDLVNLAHERVDHVILFGEAAEKIEKAFGKSGMGDRPYTIERCGNLKEAVLAARKVSEAGDVVLLSPGGTSYDEFKDFEERGERFREWVKQLI